MTNSSPPEPKSDSQKPLGLEEWIGICVALATMGIIFFWVTGSKEPELKLGLTRGLSSAKELSRTRAVEELPTDETSFSAITSNNGVGSKSSAERDFAGEGERRQQTRGLGDRQNLQSPLSRTALRGAIGISGVGMLWDRGGSSSSGVPVDAANGDTPGPTSVKSSRSVAGEGSPETGTPADSQVATGPTSVNSPGSVAGEGSPETGTPADSQVATGPTSVNSPGSVAGEGSPETDTPADSQVAAGSPTDGEDVAKAVPSQSTEFSDITDKYWAKAFIEGLGEANVLSSFPDGTFKPEQPITRGEFAIHLNGVFDRKLEEKQIKYKDVEDNYSAKSAIDLATKVGAMNGYPDGNFRPDNSMSRVEVLIALVTGLNLTPPSNVDEVLEVYEDRDRIPGWAKEKIAAATASGLVVNYPKRDVLNPMEPASRGEATAMVHQVLVFRGILKPVDSQYVVTLDQ